MSATVTVGMPFFNNEDTLKDAIRSVLNQSYENLQLLLVNDGSTDGSLAVAESFDDPRIRLINDGVNMGFAARLNHITRLTETDYLFRMDADDIIHPDRVQIQMAFLLADESLDLVSSGCWVTRPSREVEGYLRLIGQDTPTSRDIILRRSVIAHPTIAGKTEWFRCNPYRIDLKRTEDWELWIRTLSHTRHLRTPDLLYYYRLSEQINIQGYRTGKKEQRAIVSEYGPRLIGRILTYREICRSFWDEFAMTIADKVGISHLLVGRRCKPLPLGDLARAEKDLAAAIREMP